MGGPVEKVGDIVQVVTWCRQIKKWRELPFFNGVLALFLEDKMTKDPWLFLEGDVEVEMWISGKSEVFPAWSSWKGRGHSAGSDMVQTNQETERELPFLQMVFWPCF